MPVIYNAYIVYGVDITDKLYVRKNVVHKTCCSKKVNPSAVFCPKCGKKIREIVDVPVKDYDENKDLFMGLQIYSTTDEGQKIAGVCIENVSAYEDRMAKIINQQKDRKAKEKVNKIFEDSKLKPFPYLILYCNY